jgi:glycosyltransferase involved in cell wall biosynthesis
MSEATEQKGSDGLSIFFPVYNDWGTVATMVVLADAVARQLTDDYEIIAVNDASPDHSQMILEELQRVYPRLRIIRHETNRGYGGALRSGFQAATKDFVFYTDGDAQYDVRELVGLWEARAEADLVNGYKIKRSDPVHRRIVGWAYHHFVAFWFRLRIRDVDCDFRLIRRSFLQNILLREDSGLICVELVTKLQRAGARIREVPVNHYHRMHGKSQFFNIRRVLRVLFGMAGLWWRIFVRGEGPVPRAKPTPAGASAKDASHG